MPRTKISEFSATPANNTDIDSINIAEGCAPSGINDAIRELMAQLKDFQTGAVGDSFNGPIGATTASTGAFTTLSASSTLGVTGVSTLTGGAVVQGLTAGKGASALATNTALGVSALAAATTGDVNTALGYEALAGASTSGANTAVGYRALKATSTGDGNNTGLGTLALAANTTGSFNTATGRSALLTNTTGTSNSAYGVSALNTNLGGASNVAVGREALYSNTSASNNTAVGYQAGYTNQTGQYSVMVGQGAGYSIASNTITCVGAQAGYFTTGNQNQFFGNVAGYDVTSGSKNTILGAYTGNQGGLDIRTASNYIVLSDGDGNPLISTNSSRSVALNGAVPQTGTGITFPATQSASSNANTLDDYEEGTWTPTLVFGSGSTGITYNARNGRYTKIGNYVFATGFVNLSSKGSSAGDATFTGLPFSADETNRSYGGNGQFDAGGSSVPVAVQVLAFGTTAFNRYGNANNFLGLTEANFTNSSVYFFNAVYLVA